MATAKAQTGLDDFGDDSFREGLEILVRSLRDEARLNARGEAFLYPRLVGHLAQRLQVEDWYRRHPGDRRRPDRRAAHRPGLAAHRLDRAVVPARPGPGRPVPAAVGVVAAVPAAVDGAAVPTRASRRPLREPAGTKAHVPTDVERADGVPRPHGPRLQDAHLPRLRADPVLRRRGCSMPTSPRPTAYERRVLKLLQWGEPPRPWRLKTPAHVLFLDYLDRAFPDARFVMTHRDPTDVMLSVADVYADIAGVFTDHLDRPYIGRLNVEHWSVGMERAIEVPRRRRRRPLLRHRLPRHAGRSDRRGARTLRVARRAGHRRVRGAACGDGGRRTRANREPSSRTPTRRRSAWTSTQVRPLFADYVERATRVDEPLTHGEEMPMAI